MKLNKRKHKPMTDKFLVGDRKISNSKDMHFNIFFTNAAGILAAKIPDITKEATSYIEDSNINSIFVAEVSSDEISKVINSLKNTSPGWNDINSNVGKSSYRLNIAPLAH